jgi:hypothetical protein
LMQRFIAEWARAVLWASEYKQLCLSFQGCR